MLLCLVFTLTFIWGENFAFLRKNPSGDISSSRLNLFLGNEMMSGGRLVIVEFVLMENRNVHYLFALYIR